MLEVLRFWFTKDLKYAKGRPCKPYNSCLGEFFRVRTHGMAPVWDNLRLADIYCSNSATGKLKTMPL